MILPRHARGKYKDLSRQAQDKRKNKKRLKHNSYRRCLSSCSCFLYYRWGRRASCRRPCWLYCPRRVRSPRGFCRLATAFFFEFTLCLSRAYLRKIFLLYKSGRKRPCPHRATATARCHRCWQRSRASCKKQSFVSSSVGVTWKTDRICRDRLGHSPRQARDKHRESTQFKQTCAPDVPGWVVK